MKLYFKSFYVLLFVHFCWADKTDSVTRVKRFCYTCQCCYYRTQFTEIRSENPPPVYLQPTLYSNNVVRNCNQQWISNYRQSMRQQNVIQFPASTNCTNSSGVPVDICQLPLLLGEGGWNLSRWHYDTKGEICRQFTYRGLKGNQNNFLTKSLCETTCLNKTVDNSSLSQQCPFGEPGPVCSQSHVCPASHRCHNGVCCPLPDGKVCELLVDKGQGGSSTKRWYYDNSREECSEFLFHGAGGNPNNFLSKMDCEETCVRPTLKQNPCDIGTPLQDAKNKVRHCYSDTRMIHCPSGFRCHVGPDVSSTVCCPQVGNRCDLWKNVGIGNYSLPRWYYDVLESACRPFIYSGFKGNGNNFLTESQCLSECKGSENPCLEGEPVSDLLTKKAMKCKSTKDCPTGHFCHVGVSFEKAVCCRTNNSNVCQSPMSLGKGNAALVRWYYEAEAKYCSIFFYKGYKGTANMFLSKAECTNTCQIDAVKCSNGENPYADPKSRSVVTCTSSNNTCPRSLFCDVPLNETNGLCCPQAVSADICRQPVEEGDGLNKLSRWYYDGVVEACRPFIYLGSGGNGNNFVSESDCNDTCDQEQTEWLNYCPHGKPLTLSNGSLRSCIYDSNCPKTFVCHVHSTKKISICCPEPEKFCKLPKDPGDCNDAKISRYGYEPSINACVPFRYTGCGGNLNNFESIETCTEICCSQIQKRK